MGNINDFAFRERECENDFINQGPFWHLYTPGEFQEIIFKNEEDYKYGVTSSALALTETNDSGHYVRIYSFAVMSNHIHELLAGSREACMEYFRRRKSKLVRYFANKVDLSKFLCDLKRLDDLKSFRNVVAYIHRNGFVINAKETPFSYEWSSGRHYFNPGMREVTLKKVSDLSYRKKKSMLKCRGTKDYDELFFFKGYVSPLCFCEISGGESLFRNAHQYFHAISRDVESYGAIAEKLGDKIFLNDEELFSVVCRKSKEMHDNSNPKLLPAEAKTEMAIWMHKEYNASNGQIVRILKIDKFIVESLFPKAR